MRVEAILRESLNNVAIKSTDGNDEKSNGRNRYVPTRRMVKAKVILNDSKRSSTTAGRGITIKTTMPTTPTEAITSLFLVKNGILIE